MHNCVFIGILYIHTYHILPNMADVHKVILNSNFCEIIYVCQKYFNTVKLGYNTMRGTEYFMLL
jgi:hypothetical protein